MNHTVLDDMVACGVDYVTQFENQTQSVMKQRMCTKSWIRINKWSILQLCVHHPASTVESVWKARGANVQKASPDSIVSSKAVGEVAGKRREETKLQAAIE